MLYFAQYVSWLNYMFKNKGIMDFSNSLGLEELLGHPHTPCHIMFYQ